MALIRGLKDEIRASLTFSDSSTIPLPFNTLPRETQNITPTSLHPQTHKDLPIHDRTPITRTKRTSPDPTNVPARGMLRYPPNQPSPAGPISPVARNPSQVRLLESVSDTKEPASMMAPSETQTASPSSTPTKTIMPAIPTTEPTMTIFPSLSDPSTGIHPTATPTRSPISSIQLVQLPTFEVVLAGVLEDVHALTDTIAEYLILVLKRTLGLESLRGIDLTVANSHGDNVSTQISFTGIASFDSLEKPSMALVKDATISALQNIVAIQSALDSNALQVGNMTVIRVNTLETNSSEPSMSPSRMPSFRPSRGEIVTSCTIQKTQIKCLANDCEWRNQRRKCRDFVKREEIEQQNRTSAPYASERGTVMPPIAGVPPQDSVARAFIIVAIVIGSIAVLAIIGYVGKLHVLRRSGNVPSGHEAEASLLAEAMLMPAPTPQISTQLSSPPAAAHNEDGAYIRSKD